MKTAFSSQPFTLLLLLLGAGSAVATPAPLDPSLAQFEEQYANSLPYDSPAGGVNGTTLRLVGFKRMAVPADEVADFEDAWADPPSRWRRRDVRDTAEPHPFWYDRARREVRIYFPVGGALLRRGAGADAGFVEADALGQIQGVGEEVKRDIDGEGLARAVLGRRVTDQVTGVEGNVIRDGIIYLATPALPVRHLDERTTVYDFGIKSLHHDDHDHGQDQDHRKREEKHEGKKGCLQNHNGVNCSKAYGISMGRCPMNPKTCMDYNGFKTDCKKGTTHKFGIPTLSKAIKFLGSDCSVSMARGHCWNEVM